MSTPNLYYRSVIDYFNGGYFASVGLYPFFRYTLATYNMPFHSLIWYAAYDQFFFWHYQPSPGYMVRCDPAFVNNDIGSVLTTTNNYPGTATGWILGEWDRVTGIQKIYVYGAGGSYDIGVFEPGPMKWDGTYPYIGIMTATTQDNGTGAGTEGHFYITTPQGYGNIIFFETMGYALVIYGRPYFAANGGYHGEVMFTVDLSTGQAIETIPIPVRHETSPTAWEAPQLWGTNVDFRYGQFISDGDSTPAAPKGYLFLQPMENVAYRWFKIVDWNPTGAAASPGYPERVHCQVREISQLTIDTDVPPIDTPPSGLPYVQRQPIVVQGSTGKRFAASAVWPYNGGAPHTLPEHSMIGEWQATAGPAILTPPAFSGRPETNRTVDAIVHLLGDLGEKIGGVEVLFTGQQISEKGEVLDHDGVGGVVYVDYPPIDEYGTTVIYEDGTPLADTVDYDVTDFDAGEITFKNGRQLPDTIYTADYRHAQSPTAGARVNLLTPAARTNSNGTAVCRVSIPDDDALVGEWDQITATVE